jgi:hypothetical protein
MANGIVATVALLVVAEKDHATTNLDLLDTIIKQQ